MDKKIGKMYSLKSGELLWGVKYVEYRGREPLSDLHVLIAGGRRFVCTDLALSLLEQRVVMNALQRQKMKTLWQWSAGVKEDPLPYEKAERMPDPKTILKRQWNPTFIKLMKNRMVVGFFRYGEIRQQVKYDNIGSAIERLKLYQETGNQEHLVDAAGLCKVEFTQENHKDTHWNPSDDGCHTKEL